MKLCSKYRIAHSNYQFMRKCQNELILNQNKNSNIAMNRQFQPTGSVMELELRNEFTINSHFQSTSCHFHSRLFRQMADNHRRQSLFCSFCVLNTKKNKKQMFLNSMPTECRRHSEISGKNSIALSHGRTNGRR